MAFLDFLLGQPLAASDERAERIGPAAGVPIFGLDALSSAAYGPEAALTLLIPLGAAGVSYILPVSAAILVLLGIVFLSYRQTIAAYPGGGGSYTVARQNLGSNAGLLAAAALMIDYVLVVAVGISAGVGALVSAFPALHEHMVSTCLVLLFAITIINLRGVRESGVVLMVPTYLFLGCLGITILIGVMKVVLSGGQPRPVEVPPAMPPATAALSTWLILKVFSSGCTALTGVEAVSNGVKAFRDPATKNAQTALTIIIVLLVVLLGGIAFLCSAYGIGATAPGAAGYQTVLSMLIAAVLGKGWFYYLSMVGIFLVLAFSANTGFADFPRLCRIVARDGYLPHSFASTGRRLVYSQGINVLAVLAAGLLWIFNGVTDHLIPLFAVGAFLAFTLSQAGMVVHWWRENEGRFTLPIFVNALGALATGVTVLVVLAAKFAEGAWVTVLLMPVLVVIMASIRHHYHRVYKETALRSPADLTGIHSPIVILPVQGWSRITEKSLRFCYTLSSDVRALHVLNSDEPSEAFCQQWDRFAAVPARAAGLVPPRLEVIESPYRWVLRPLMDRILQIEDENPGRQIAVIVGELVTPKWYLYLLHNQRASVLKGLLLVRGSKRIAVINVPWYLGDQ